MNPDETVILARYVRALCPQQKFDEYTADAWHDVLRGFPLDEARAAAAVVVARQPFVSPGEIVTEIRRARTERMRQHTNTFEPQQHPELDPDDVRGYHQALRADRMAVATGHRPPVAAAAITAGVTPDDISAMRQQGDLRDFLRQAVTDAAAENKRRRTLVARYPDLRERMHALPGHAKWSGSVGGNRATAAIVAEAEARATGQEQAA